VADDENTTTIELSERDINALRWTVPILRGVEGEWSKLAGIRVGEATSDVIAAIVARADAAREPRP
jgi:hypothetical protein